MKYLLMLTGLMVMPSFAADGGDLDANDMRASHPSIEIGIIPPILKFLMK